MNFISCIVLRSGVEPILDNAHEAVRRGSADRQLRAFEKKLKAVVERTLAHDGDGLLFKPPRGQTQ